MRSKKTKGADTVKHYIRVTAGPHSGAIYEFATKSEALALARALEKLRPHSTDYGNDRDGFPEVHLKGRRAATSHATKKDYDWSSFVDGAAFAFWASPYISEVENLAEDAREAERKYESKKAKALREAYAALSPGSGGAWKSVLPTAPPSAVAVAKKFTKAVKDKLTDEQLSEIEAKFSAHDAGYYGAMQSQGEGVGWFDEGVKVDPPRGFDWDPKIQNAIGRAISKGAREAGIRLPRR